MKLGSQQHGRQAYHSINISSFSEKCNTSNCGACLWFDSMDNDCTLGAQEQGLLLTILTAQDSRNVLRFESYFDLLPEVLFMFTQRSWKNWHISFPTAIKTDACSEHYVNPPFSLQWCCHRPCRKEIQIHSEMHLCTDLRVLWFVYHNLWIVDH